MTDQPDRPTDATSDKPPAEDQAGLRGRLYVEPLDEMTRARLVRDALAAAPAQNVGHGSRSPVRWLAVAAVIVAMVALGVGVLTHNSDAPETTAGAPSAKATATPSSPALDAEAAVPSLGKLGEIGARAQLRAAVNAAEARGRFQSACPMPDAGVAAVLISGGTGTVDGNAASVYVFGVPNVGKVAVAVRDQDCRTALTVAL